MNTFNIISHNVPFTVHVVHEGQSYGLNNSLNHNDEDPLVEFYDNRYKHTEFGQFISRYNLSTLLDNQSGAGLNLQGGEPQWYIEGKDMKEIIQWLKTSVINQYLDNIQGESHASPKLK